MTEKRSRSLTRSLSDKFVEPLTNVRPLSLSFLSDHDKKKSRDRDPSRESRPSQSNRDKSKDKTREHRFRDFRSRENSVEKTKFTYHDRSNSYNGFPFKDPSLENKKNADHRKISKQNTYVLQNGKSPKHVKKTESESSFQSTRSVENMDYSRVIDDISPIPENEEESESHYAEICDNARRNQGLARGDAPHSLPNLNLSAKEGKKKEKVSRKISRELGRLSNISLRDSGISLRDSGIYKKPVCRRSISSPSESGSYRSSSRASGSGVFQEDSLSKTSSESLERDKVKRVYREVVAEKDKVNEVEREDVLKKDKVKEIYDEGTLEKGKMSEGDNEEMLEKDKVNEVYIIRVVVKDKEEDKMSTLAKGKSGGYYMKIRGFEVPKEELGGAVSGDDINGYDSLC